MPASPEHVCDGCGRLRDDVQPVSAWRDQATLLEGHPDAWAYCAACAAARADRPIVTVSNRVLFADEAVAQGLLDAPAPAKRGR